MTIKKSKVDALYTHLVAGGAADAETVSGILGCEVDDTDTMEAYMRAVNKRTEAASTPQDVEESDPVTVAFRNSDNTLEELEVVRVKGSRIIVQKAVKRDLVKIIVGGEVTTVDCEELRNLPADAEYAKLRVTVSDLLTAAKLARA